MNGSDFFIIQHGSFHAAVLYSALEHLPIRNLKKLFRLAKKAQFENEAAIQGIRSYFDTTIPEAQETMRAAARAYAAMFGFDKLREAIAQMGANKD